MRSDEEYSRGRDGGHQDTPEARMGFEARQRDEWFWKQHQSALNLNSKLNAGSISTKSAGRPPQDIGKNLGEAISALATCILLALAISWIWSAVSWVWQLKNAYWILGETYDLVALWYRLFLFEPAKLILQAVFALYDFVVYGRYSLGTDLKSQLLRLAMLAFYLLIFILFVAKAYMRVRDRLAGRVTSIRKIFYTVLVSVYIGPGSVLIVLWVSIICLDLFRSFA